MGVCLSKEKSSEATKEFSKSNIDENNYKIKFKIYPENEIGGGDVNLWVMIIIII